jgi:hypothetical protein
MPRYFFHHSDGHIERDNVGTYMQRALRRFFLLVSHLETNQNRFGLDETCALKLLTNESLLCSRSLCLQSTRPRRAWCRALSRQSVVGSALSAVTALDRHFPS